MDQVTIPTFGEKAPDFDLNLQMYIAPYAPYSESIDYSPIDYCPH